MPKYLHMHRHSIGIGVTMSCRSIRDVITLNVRAFLKAFALCLTLFISRSSCRLLLVRNGFQVLFSPLMLSKVVILIFILVGVWLSILSNRNAYIPDNDLSTISCQVSHEVLLMKDDTQHHNASQPIPIHSHPRFHCRGRGPWTSLFWSMDSDLYDLS